jgi:hypothetical protein
MLNVAPITVRGKIEAGELPAVQLDGPGSSIRIPRPAFQLWLWSDITEATPDDEVDAHRRREYAKELAKVSESARRVGASTLVARILGSAVDVRVRTEVGAAGEIGGGAGWGASLPKPARIQIQD